MNGYHNRKSQFAIGNPGRPKGSPDKISSKIRAMYRKLIEDNMDQLQEDIKNMKPRERIDAIIRLSSFVLPKLRQVEIFEMPDIYELLQMSKDERREMLIKLKSEINEQER